MMRFPSLRKTLVALGLVAVPLAAGAAGFYTPGLFTPQPSTSLSYAAPNGTYNPGTITGSSLGTGFNGLNYTGTGISNYTYANEPGGYELAALDTNMGQGAQPQTISTSIFMMGAVSSAAILNTATATAGAASVTGLLGSVTAGGLATAAGSTYTLTITDSAITATQKVQVAAYLGTSTAGQLQLVSVTPTAGSLTVVVKNIGTAALNGSVLFLFQAA